MAIDTLRSASHLQGEIGDHLFAALVSSDHTEAVRKFARELFNKDIPAEIQIGGRTYEILGFTKDKGAMNNFFAAASWFHYIGANLNQEEREHLLKHRDDIPMELARKISFVFPNWRESNEHGEYVNFITWVNFRLIQSQRHTEFDWPENYRVFRRKA